MEKRTDRSMNQTSKPSFEDSESEREGERERERERESNGHTLVIDRI
jgi:hypothetical protein